MSKYIEQTKKWLESVVIGLNFCPFAKAEFVNNKIRYVVCDSKADISLLKLVKECQYLDQYDEVSTTLIIFPNSLNDFEEYLTVIDLADESILEFGYEGIYQVASFHPDYLFHGSHDADPTNYTNRSPYPMLHILREEYLETQISKHPHPENIPFDNMDKAKNKGLDIMKMLLAESYLIDKKK